MDKYKGLSIEKKEDSITISSYNYIEGRFLKNNELKEIALELLSRDKNKNKIIFYDGCMSYNIKNEEK